MIMTDAESAGISKTKSQKRKMIIAATIAISIIVVVVVIYFGILPNSPLKNTGVAGIYYAEPPLTGAYIELKADGTAYFHSQYGYGYSGTWELTGSNRIYMRTSAGMAAYLTLEGKTLTEEGSGYKYIRR